MGHLTSSHEEADTRIVLHAADAATHDIKLVVVCSRDTDVLVLLAFHKTATEVWMDAGTKKKPKWIPAHTVLQNLPEPVLHNLLAYHAIRGCDSTSQFSGHGKKSYWSTYLSAPELLDSFTNCTESAFIDAERFVIKMYSPLSSSNSVDVLRSEMFHKISNPERLPPTKDALVQHFNRCLYQMKVWLNATVPSPVLKSPEESGWYISDGKLMPVLTTTEAVPDMCVELLTSGRKTKRCNSKIGTCKTNKIMCSLGCACAQDCLNPYQAEDESDLE